MNIVKISA